MRLLVKRGTTSRELQLFEGSSTSYDILYVFGWNELEQIDAHWTSDDGALMLAASFIPRPSLVAVVSGNTCSLFQDRIEFVSVVTGCIELHCCPRSNALFINRCLNFLYLEIMQLPILNMQAAFEEPVEVILSRGQALEFKGVLQHENILGMIQQLSATGNHVFYQGHFLRPLEVLKIEPVGGIAYIVFDLEDILPLPIYLFSEFKVRPDLEYELVD